MVITGVDILQPSGESLVAWGANFRPVTLAGEWWRLITCCFLHIGILHLLLNMYALMYIGLLLEPYLGKLRFTAAYLLAGIAASLTSLWWHDLTISAGASGAIFGMYGVFLAMLTTNLIEKSARRELLTSIAVFVGYNLVYGLKGGIDNAAHIGGLVSGLVIGYAYLPGLKNPASPKLVNGAIALLTVAVVGLTILGFKTISNDFGIYQERVKGFFELEAQALKVYSMPENTSRAEYMMSIQNDGIVSWNESKKLITELDLLDLPDAVHKQNRIFLDYIDLRLKSYRLLYLTAEQDTDKYRDSLAYYNNEISSVLDQLKEE
jgi:rhomboid protease GluP